MPGAASASGCRARWRRRSDSQREALDVSEDGVLRGACSCAGGQVQLVAELSAIG